MAMARRRGMRTDQAETAMQARQMGMPWPEIAAILAEEFKLVGFAAIRLAHRWSQWDAAKQWTALWPHDPKTFKNFSYWENWNKPSGFSPNLRQLSRLAELYECAVADLVVGIGDFRRLDLHHPGRDTGPPGAAQTLTVALAEVWQQLAEASIEDIAGSGLLWAGQHPDHDQAGRMLLNLSAGLGLAATHSTHSTGISAGAATADGKGRAGTGRAGVNGSRSTAAPAGSGLVGIWHSHRRPNPNSRTAAAGNGRRSSRHGVEHTIVVTGRDGRFHGRNLPHLTGIQLRLDLEQHDRHIVVGTFTEHHPAGATAHGIAQFVADDQDGERRLDGRWLAYTGRAHPDEGDWTLTWHQDRISGTALLTHRATPTAPTAPLSGHG